ncbi:MAG: GNAT family N-acetyltransferase [Massiliimalia sp.]|jgi:GNAT superfamily N-acetyltransferase
MKNIILLPYTDYCAEEIIPLYEAVGWSNYYNNPDMLYHAFRNSLFVLGAYVDDVLVGIIRVVGDGYSIVYIQDLLVLPEYQRQGIGGKLIAAVIQKFSKVGQKILLTDKTKDMISFYHHVGFAAVDDIDCVAFQYRDFAIK